MAHKHKPKAVKTRFTEKLPERLRRKSRPLAKAGVAGVRLRVMDLLNRRGGLPADAIRKLDEDGRALVRRMAMCPSNPDYPNRREAVTALALLGDAESFGMLVFLACDGDADDVIVARAISGLAEVGGPTARAVVMRACKSNRRHVRNQALCAATKLYHHPDLLDALRAAAAKHPSESVRSAARDHLSKLGVRRPKAWKNTRPPIKRRIRRGA